MYALVGVFGGVLLYKLARVRRKNETVEKVVIGEPELLQLAKSCLIKAGSSQANAAKVAEVLVLADARGISSHGTNRLELYCDEVKRKAVVGEGAPVLEKDTPACGYVNGNNLQGAVVGTYCMELAIKKARECGVGVVVAYNTNHYGIAGYYALMAARQGMLGFSFCNTSPVVVPTRSRKAALGTNPIAIAGPTQGEPVCLDMATSVVPFGRVEVYLRQGKPVPLGWGVDSTGTDTTDPAKIIFGGGLHPLGGQEHSSGYKGYGLSLMVEMLCGVLANAKFGPQLGMSMNPNAVNRTDPINLGQSFIAIDPDSFTVGYAQRMQTLVDLLHTLPTMQGAPGPVLVPGEKEARNFQLSQQNGIQIDRKIAQALVKCAQSFDVPVPAAFQGLE